MDPQCNNQDMLMAIDDEEKGNKYLKSFKDKMAQIVQPADQNY